METIAENHKLSFTVYGVAVPKARPRAFNIPGRKFPVVTTAPTTREWEKKIWFAAQGKVQTLMAAPLILTVTFFLPRPKSLPKKVIHHVKRPDLDNLVKSVKDALNGVVWRDDSQVFSLHIYKRYGDPPRVEITVQEVVPEKAGAGWES